MPDRPRDGGRALSDVPACLACGTCCFSTLERYVRVTGDDHARLGARAEELTRFVGNRAYMKMTDGHCAALRIETLAMDASHASHDGADARFVCGVYDERPDVCRDLARGSRECLGEIATKGARPLLAVAALTALSRRRAVPSAV